MATEEQIKILAYSIWQQEGCPLGKNIEHYYRAKRILEERETERVIELGAPEKRIELETPATKVKPAPKTTAKSRGRKKKIV